MPGPRQSLEVLEGKGRKHLSRSERAQRAAGSRVIDTEALDVATRIQDRFFKQCRGCANDMGLTVTSRCRLVLPESARPPEENAFERPMREKRERMQRA